MKYTDRAIENHRLLKCTRAFIGGGGGGSTPQRNLTNELLQTAAGYKATAPDYFALNSNPDYGQPAYTRLGLDTAKIAQQGYTDAEGNYHEGTTALGQETASSNRAANIMDLLGFGPAATTSLFNANPFLGNATANSANLLDMLSGQAADALSRNGALTPEEEFNASQATQAGFADRGIGNGNSSLITDVLNRDSLVRQRQQQAQSFASGVAGQQLGAAQTYSSTITNPLMQILGFGNLTPGYNGSPTNTTQDAIANSTALFNPTNPYAADVYNSNFNAQAAQNIADQNNSAATNAALIGLVGSIFSDERLKKKVKTIGKTPSGVPIKKYVYKHDPQEREYVGGTAQDIEEIFPEAVQTDLISGLKAVDYSKTDVPFGLVEMLRARMAA